MWLRKSANMHSGLYSLHYFGFLNAIVGFALEFLLLLVSMLCDSMPHKYK